MDNRGERAGRLIVVSNRLPFSISISEGTIQYQESDGGLVAGISAYVGSLTTVGGSCGYVWVGWPGATVEEALHAKLRDDAMRLFHSVPVFLSNEDMEQFYHGFCNKTIWPLFHYFPSLVECRDESWEVYRRVNATFCDAIAEVIKPGDVVWVHDYHLMLLPKLLRARVPDAAIGFFLHIPFPSVEMFRLLPASWRVEILEGFLASDLIGFHTYEYTQHFLQSVLRILGYDHHMGQVLTRDGVSKADTFPLGIDFDRFWNASNRAEVQDELGRLRATLPGASVILSVDRLDYTKGIVNRLQAFEILLTKYPRYREKVVLLMIVVPSRVAVDQYATMRKQIDELVGNINGTFGTVGWTPVVYQYRQIPFATLAALYGRSDICLVTPLRDGMNLVAKEYVASRTDGTGVLILSEMAGSAKELPEAIIINPNHRGEIAEAMHEALEVPRYEQRRRLERMQGRLRRFSAKRWAEDIIREIGSMLTVRDSLSAKLLDASAKKSLVERFRKSSKRLLLLDYDGTLLPLVRHPDLAQPGEALKNLLMDLSSDPATHVVIVSGRDRHTLGDWLGQLDVGLVAEHGAWMRDPGREWRTLKHFKSDWKQGVMPILQQYADRLPGAFVEEKDLSLGWHYRNADPDQAKMLAAELTDNIVTFTANIDVHVLQGNKVVEVRNAGVDKGIAALEWLSRGEYDFVLGVGDDWTDEDLFKALSDRGISIRVGLTRTHAQYNLRTPADVIALLESLLSVRTKANGTSVRMSQDPQVRSK